ncbi:hypothetical protein [Porphyrobacter sp. AAP60]|uniref:hypothetical protein n=1 Tax=Porphyrobacter sp. AAP60 TaxID=1523423 RepID=UPI0006B891DF|nr:hypothetical protein [Porphyrobacter sp. AAP60]KPF61742.1 hypothetical protein IP79_14875 [Porphyrobacter sp. AAP60]
MVFGLFGLFLFVVVLVMVTLGAVLLAHFIFGATRRSTRVVAATLGGPLTLVLPMFAIMLFDGGVRSGTELVAVIAILMSISSGMAWPIAHFATRRLDQSTQFDPQVFA